MKPVLLYLKPHHSHRAMGEAIDAEFVEMEHGSPLDKIRAARNLDLSDRTVITEGGKPLFQAAWMKLFGNCGSLIHLAADETLPNVFEKYPHYEHHERTVHFLEHFFVDGVIGISDQICRSASRLGIDDVVKTYPFTTPEKYRHLSELSPDLDSSSVLVVGHNQPKNNLGILQDVADEMRHDVSFEVLGRDTEELTGTDVNGHGFVEQDRFVEVAGECSCFACTAYPQPFGVVVLEAMHAALTPVVTTEVGAKEVVREVDKGLIVPPESGAIAKRLDWLLGLPPEQRRDLSTTSREVGEEYTPERGRERFVDAYRAVTGNRR